MDWFERLTGFREGSYDETRSRLKVEGKRLLSLANGEQYATGKLELVSLRELRQRLESVPSLPSRALKVDIVRGDVREMHRLPQNAGALFQVASQFNLLEMIDPSVTPEDGVTRYQGDHTQGPACAIAAGAATIYRNYFAPVGGGAGQTATRQLDGLADLGAVLSERMNCPVRALWTTQNGYALCSASGLRAIAAYLEGSSADEIDDLRGRLRIGLHWDVEATEAHDHAPQLSSQAFCSALPIAYTSVPRELWRAFAVLVLESAYEATMIAAKLNARRGASNVVLLTQLGGGAFGNASAWIEDALRRALRAAVAAELQVGLVCYGEPSSGLLKLAKEFNGG
ncbi:hypothetical protein JQ615_21500 [Bradyrhizobium jicamae]|uniref:Macro domain-containing protein n=1 Tax=Bradyrhizobium jicamae TaxID=280332 RepID=A0ABS5FMG9_9BRAD|nr:hypothetical protein [Bradyrhizobium jicamae]MBR0797969.1 hypothetical protein [Bradyrhizobium jicamae]